MTASVGAIRAGRAYVELSADNQKLIAGLKRAEESVARFGAKASEIGATFATLGAAAAAPLAFAVQGYAAFDDQMRVVQAVSGSTGEEFEALTAKARRLGATTSFTAAEVANAMAELGRAGFKAPQIDAAIDSVMNLSRSTQTEIPLATEIAGNALRAFDLEASETERVCDVLTATANNSSQTLEDLGEAFKFVAPIAADAGLSIEDSAKILGTLANFGIKGSLAGTAFKNIQLKMADPAVQKSYEELGVSVIEADGSLRNMAEVLRDLGAATASMPNAEKLATYQNLFSMYGLSGGIKLTNANFAGMYDAIDNSQGVAAKTAATADAGIGGAFRNAESAIEDLKHAIGDALEPTLMELAADVQRVCFGTSAWIAENKETVVWIAKAAAVAAVAGGAVLALGQGAKIASSTFSAFRSVGERCVGVLNALTGSSNAATRASRARAIAQKKSEAATKAEAQATRALNAETKANATARALAQKIAKAEEQAAQARFVGERLSYEAQANSIRGAYELAAARREEATQARRAAEATAQSAREAANSAIQTSRAAASSALLRRSFAALAASLGPTLALGAVVYAINRFGEASAKAANAARKESEATAERARSAAALRSEHERMFERLKELSNKTELTNAEFAEGAAIANRLQTAYGDLGITVDATAKKFGGLTEAARKFNEAQLEQELRDKRAQQESLANEDAKISREFKALQGSGGFWKAVGSWFGGQSLEDRHAELADRREEIRTEQANLAADIAALETRLNGARQDSAQAAQNPQAAGSASGKKADGEGGDGAALAQAKQTSDDYEEGMIDDPFEKRRKEIADRFDAYAEAQKTIAAASSSPYAESIRASNVSDAQERAARETRLVDFEERLAEIAKGSGTTETRRDLGWARARNAAANAALANATTGRFTAEEKREALDRKTSADKGVKDAEKELRAAKLSNDAKRIKAAEGKLADASARADAETTNYASFDVETARALVRQTTNDVKRLSSEASREDVGAAYARFVAANKALDDAYASGDEKQIAAAEEEVSNSQTALETANADLAGIVEGVPEARAVVESSGSFNAFEAAGLGANDWEKTEMEKQSALLQKIADATEKTAKANDEGDDDAI